MAQKECIFEDVIVYKNAKDEDTTNLTFFFLFFEVQDKEFEINEWICEIEIYKGEDLKYQKKYPIKDLTIDHYEGDEIIIRFPNIKKCLRLEIDKRYNTLQIERKNNIWRAEYFDVHIDIEYRK